MRNAVVLAGVLLLMPLSAARCGPAPGGGDAQSAIVLEPGEYLRDDYVQNLKSTLSPHRSFVLGTPQMAIVELDGSAAKIILIFNFHEGGPEFLWNNGLKISLDAGSNLENLKFAIIDKSTFMLSEGSFGKHTYINVGDSSVFVSSLLFAGTYSDSHGNEYSFGKNGMGSFAGKPMTYSVGTDYVLVPDFDYIGIAMDGTTAVYGFEVKPEKILLCETSGERNETINKDGCFELIKKGRSSNLLPFRP